MRVPPQARRLPGDRLHLQHGPIDLILGATGAGREADLAFAAAQRRFATILEELVAELPRLRRPARPGDPEPSGRVARRMSRAVAPYAAAHLITPMAAVAGAVAEEILEAMIEAAPIRRAFVNNGGDIALHLEPGERFRIGLVDRPDRPGLFGTTEIAAEDGLHGIATSGWRGRSFSFGIADAVTILAARASEADAAASVVANAVDLPGHPAIRREPANAIQADSDLGDRRVTRDVGPLSPAEIDEALRGGLAAAEDLIARGLIRAVACHCAGETRVAGAVRAIGAAGPNGLLQKVG